MKAMSFKGGAPLAGAPFCGREGFYTPTAKVAQIPSGYKTPPTQGGVRRRAAELHTPALRATPLHGGDAQFTLAKIPSMKRGARRAGCVGGARA